MITLGKSLLVNLLRAAGTWDLPAGSKGTGIVGHRYRQWVLVGLGVLATAGAVLVVTQIAADQPVAVRPGAAAVGARRFGDEDLLASSGAVLPGQFPPGACVAFAPMAGNRHSTVFLDAGHGGPDTGAVGNTAAGQPVQEKNLTLPVVLDAAALLRADGYRVVLSRTQDVPLVATDVMATPMSGALTVAGIHRDHVGRTRCADVVGASVLISVHFNGFDDASAGGITTVYDPSRPFSARNQRLARLIQQDVRGALAAHGWQVADRGVVPDTDAGGPAHSPQGEDYGHLMILGPASPGYQDVPSMMPGALVEPLFITNPTEASIAASPDGQRMIAKGIVAAAEQFDPGR